MSVELEICCFSLKSAIAADVDGVNRIELCGGFLEGGVTPSNGLIEQVLSSVSTDVYIMIRPRGGDFLYSSFEQKVIQAEIASIKKLNPAGFVFGALSSDGSVDKVLCKKVIDWCSPLPVTFHRAFDVSSDLDLALSDVINLGFKRILTSGGSNSAIEGIEVLKKLSEKAGDSIQIMAGAGVTIENLDEFVKVGLPAVHTTAKAWNESNMEFKSKEVNMASGSLPNEFGMYETEREKVNSFIQKLYKQ